MGISKKWRTSKLLRNKKWTYGIWKLNLVIKSSELLILSPNLIFLSLILPDRQSGILVYSNVKLSVDSYVARTAPSTHRREVSAGSEKPQGFQIYFF